MLLYSFDVSVVETIRSSLLNYFLHYMDRCRGSNNRSLLSLFHALRYSCGV